MKNNYTKSQTATEYIIIIAVVIVIAMVAINLLGGFSGFGGGTSKKITDLKLKTQIIGIDNYLIGETSSTFSLKNNHYDLVQVIKFNVGNNPNLECNSSTTFGKLPLFLNAGESVLLNCTAVNNAVYPIAETVTPSVSIVYNDPSTGVTYTINYAGSGDAADSSNYPVADFCVSGTINPDATGNYFYAGNYSGNPSYAREDGTYNIWFWGFAPGWTISLEPVGSTAHGAWITLSSNSLNDIPGSKVGGGSFEGNATITIGPCSS